MVYLRASGMTLHRLRTAAELIVDLLHVGEDKIDIIRHHLLEALRGDLLPWSVLTTAARLPRIAGATARRDYQVPIPPLTAPFRIAWCRAAVSAFVVPFCHAAECSIRMRA